MSACLCGRWCFCLVHVLEFSLWLKRWMAAFVTSVQSLSFCGVFWRRDRGVKWRSAPEVQNSSSWSSAGSGGVVGVLPSSPFHFLPGCGYCSPPPPSAEFDPWADVLLRRSSMGADLRVCVAVLHHAGISARKLNSSLVRSVLLWCSAKLSPPQLCCKRFISQTLSRVCGGLRLEFLCTGAPRQLAGL